MMIALQSPGWLVALLLLPFTWLQWTRYGMGVPQRLRFRVAVMRSLVLLLLILALAGPRWSGRSPGLDLVLVVDASDSMVSRAESLASQYTTELQKLLGAQDRLGVVVFGQDALVYKPLAESADGHLPFLPDGTGTNLERALRVAAALSPPHRSARLLLVSDGRETMGSAVQAATALGESGLAIDVLPLGETPTTELMVDSFNVPIQAGAGEPFTARAVISSTDPTQARVYLFREGTLIEEREVQLGAGRNLITFPNLMQEVGIATYELRVESVHDTFTQNNVGQGVVITADEPRVLLLTSEVQESAPLHAALVAQGIPVDVQTTNQTLWDAGTLAEYAAVLLHNVPATELSTRHLTELSYYVRQMGGGLVIIGGDRSFGLGGYVDTVLEEISPLQVRAPEHLVMPSVAMVLVIDKSGSMNDALGTGDASKIDLAKEAVIAVAGDLDRQDLLGVVAFDSRSEWIVPLGPVQDRELVVAQVLRLQADGGTNIYIGLDEAHRALTWVDAGVKHVILLSDGQSSRADFRTTLTRMRSQGITVSTVGIGLADVALLQEIATLGGGRHYYTNDPQRIPFIFTSETRIVAPLPYEERRVQPVVADGEEFLAGMPHELPPLDGFLVTHAKAEATVNILADDEIPLLGSWRYGLGRVAAFTGALSPAWAAEWLEWDGLAPLWGQVVRWAMRPGLAGSVQGSMQIHRGVGRIWVDALNEAGTYMNHLKLTAEVRTAEGTSVTLRLQQVGPGRYEATFPAESTGTWTATIHDEDGLLPHPLVTGAAVAFPEEYRFLGPDMNLLTSLAAASGGRVLSGVADLPSLLADHEAPSSMQPMWQWLLLAALIVFMFDLGVRYVPKGTLSYTWHSLRAKGRKGASKVRAQLQQESLSSHIQKTLEQERTPAPIDSGQKASREAHIALARLRKERRTSKGDPSKPVDS